MFLLSEAIEVSAAD